MKPRRVKPNPRKTPNRPNPKAKAKPNVADLGFRQAELQLRIVIGRNAVMPGERHFETAAKGEAVERDRDRLAAGFELAKRLVQREARVELGLLDFGFALGLGGTTATSAVAHFAEVGTGAEAAGLARGNHEALDRVIGRDFLREGDDVGDGLAGQRVHAAAGDVEHGMGDAVRVDVE